MRSTTSLTGLAELTLSIYFGGPAGNVVEAWDFLEHGDGAREGVEALT